LSYANDAQRLLVRLEVYSRRLSKILKRQKSSSNVHNNWTRCSRRGLRFTQEQGHETGRDTGRDIGRVIGRVNCMVFWPNSKPDPKSCRILQAGFQTIFQANDETGFQGGSCQRPTTKFQERLFVIASHIGSADNSSRRYFNSNGQPPFSFLSEMCVRARKGVRLRRLRCLLFSALLAKMAARTLVLLNRGGWRAQMSEMRL
jgi:hypothetical protein